MSGYLDDFLNCEKNFEACEQAICCTYNTLVSLGFLPNDKKSVYTPCQIIEHLGHILNSVTMTVYLPFLKTEAILALCDHTLSKEQFTVRFLYHVIGKLVSCFVAHPLGQLHYRSLERLKVWTLATTQGDFEALVSLDAHSISNLKWWLQTLPSAAAPINRGVPTSVFTCDASLKAWSGCFNGNTAQGHFSLLESPYSINCKELLVVLYSLHSHVHNFQGQHILILSDSTTAISVVKAIGSMKNIVHDTIAQDIWHVAEENKIWISISFIPGRFNFESDRGSREISHTTEWALPQATFQKLLQHFQHYGPVIMDLFASQLKYKLQPYCSFGPDPLCVHVDCFTMLWDSPYIYYANPPFSIIPKTLQHIQQQIATVMLVFLFWQQQVWLNKLLELLISDIVILPRKLSLYLPWEPATPHPLEGNLDLCTAIISGDLSKQMEFQKNMWTSSLPTDQKTIRQLFHANSTSGKAIAWRGKLIPLTHLWTKSPITLDIWTQNSNLGKPFVLILTLWNTAFLLKQNSDVYANQFYNCLPQ